MAYDYEWFKKAVYDLTKIDLNSYKEKQMKRRIDTLIGKYDVKGYDVFAALIKKGLILLYPILLSMYLSFSEMQTSGILWIKRWFPNL